MELLRIYKMRKLYYIILFVLYSSSLYSQENKVGIGVSANVDFIGYNDIVELKIESPIVYNFGVLALYNYTDKLFFETGLLYSTYTKKINSENRMMKFNSDYMFKLPLNVNYFITNKNNLFVGGGLVFVFKPKHNDLFRIGNNTGSLLIKNVTSRELFVNYKINSGYFFYFNKSKLMVDLSLNFTTNSMDKNIIDYRDQYFKYDMNKMYYSLGVKYFFL